MSQKRYNFLWDPEIRHFAYEPENQKEVDDIFRTMGKIYKTMYFSVYLEEADHHFVKESSTIEGAIRQSTKNPIKKSKARKKKELNPDLQGVDELVTA